MVILIVDDSRIMRSIIKNTLSGYHAFQDALFLDASDGIAAWEFLEKQHVDFLLLDWNMPRLNGLDLVKRIRATENLAELPIIMVTSEAARYSVIEAVKAGVTDYLVKPVSVQSLLEKVNRIFPGVLYRR